MTDVPGAQSAADAPEPDAAIEDTGQDLDDGADDSGAEFDFADAFAPQEPDGDGDFTPEDYQALAAEFADPDDDEAAWANLVARRERIAQAAGLPEELWPRLIGETDDEIAADIEELRALSEPASRREQGYRQRLRDAETEVGRLQDLVEGMQRAEIQRLASERLVDPADLFRDAELDAMLDGDGNVDPARVSAAIDAAIKAHPHFELARPPYRGALRSGATQQATAPPSKSWGSGAAFGPRPD